jgi:Flp pilus assembly protein TadD
MIKSVIWVLAILATAARPVLAAENADAGSNAASIAAIEQAMAEQRFLDAATLIDQTLLTSGDDPRIMLLAGDLSLAKGDAKQAAGSFQRIAPDSPGYDHAQEGLGIAEAMLGHSERAMGLLLSAVSRNPEAWRAWNVLGAQYDRQHNWEKADEAYSHALSRGGALVLNNRGYSRLARGDIEAATADFVAALNLRPDFKQARTNLRLALAMKGDYTRAVEGSDANDRAVLNNNAGFVAMVRGDYGQAKTLLAAANKDRGKFYALAAANLSAAEALERGAAAGPRQ